ncbi:hypothetical protein J6590_072181 [Homalodisca vitripennis]|nr:hypothetical protein J6590_072181 [Homalodisca vitripennis]
MKHHGELHWLTKESQSGRRREERPISVLFGAHVISSDLADCSASVGKANCTEPVEVPGTPSSIMNNVGEVVGRAEGAEAHAVRHEQGLSRPHTTVASLRQYSAARGGMFRGEGVASIDPHDAAQQSHRPPSVSLLGIDLGLSIVPAAKLGERSIDPHDAPQQVPSSAVTGDPPHTTLCSPIDRLQYLFSESIWAYRLFLLPNWGRGASIRMTPHNRYPSHRPPSVSLLGIDLGLSIVPAAKLGERSIDPHDAPQQSHRPPSVSLLGIDLGLSIVPAAKLGERSIDRHDAAQQSHRPPSVSLLGIDSGLSIVPAAKLGERSIDRHDAAQQSHRPPSVSLLGIDLGLSIVPAAKLGERSIDRHDAAQQSHRPPSVSLLGIDLGLSIVPAAKLGERSIDPHDAPQQSHRPPSVSLLGIDLGLSIVPAAKLGERSIDRHDAAQQSHRPPSVSLLGIDSGLSIVPAAKLGERSIDRHDAAQQVPSSAVTGDPLTPLCVVPSTASVSLLGIDSDFYPPPYSTITVSAPRCANMAAFVREPVNFRASIQLKNTISHLGTRQEHKSVAVGDISSAARCVGPVWLLSNIIRIGCHGYHVYSTAAPPCKHNVHPLKMCCSKRIFSIVLFTMRASIVATPWMGDRKAILPFQAASLPICKPIIRR